VDIGGQVLNLYCSGTGGPAVIFESGATWPFYKAPKAMFENGSPRPGYSWVRIQREVAKLTTACWYDRAGSGWSDLGPYPRDSAAQARDLHALLNAAGVPPPYVLVAESSAALDARVYTSAYPAEVAGLVFVNGVHPDLFEPTRSGKRPRAPQFAFHSQDVAARWFNLVGLYRLGASDRPAAGPAPDGMTDAEWKTIWHLTQASKARSALMQDIASCALSMAEARAAGSLGNRPLIVLSSQNAELAPEYRGLWAEQQTELAALSARGKQVAVEESSGDLIYRAPGAIIDAARQVIGGIRN